jgi:hypothetical protein
MPSSIMAGAFSGWLVPLKLSGNLVRNWASSGSRDYGNVSGSIVMLEMHFQSHLIANRQQT